MYLDTIAPPSAYTAPAAEVSADAPSIRVTRQSREPSAETAELSVLTYNVRGLPWPLAFDRAKALRNIGRELAAMRDEGRQPDVVLIQEGFRGEIATLVRESGYRYWARGPGRDERTAFHGEVVQPRDPLKGEGLGKVFGAGLHVLSDMPILEVRTAAFNNCAGFDCLANKGAMLVRLQPEWSPTPIDVVNTHMNARKASGAPRTRNLPAHQGQTAELNAFLSTYRDADHPLIVGGDFNVRNSAARYEHLTRGRPYTVVSEFCNQPGSGCGAGAPDARGAPWLRTQDLQGFGDGVARVQPVKSEFVFDRGAQRLSDHDGYLVRYQLSWTAQAVAAYRPDPSVEVKPHKLGFRVSWIP